MGWTHRVQAYCRLPIMIMAITAAVSLAQRFTFGLSLPRWLLPEAVYRHKRCAYAACQRPAGAPVPLPLPLRAPTPGAGPPPDPEAWRSYARRLWPRRRFVG